MPEERVSGVGYRASGEQPATGSARGGPPPNDTIAAPSPWNAIVSGLPTPDKRVATTRVPRPVSRAPHPASSTAPVLALVTRAV